VSGEVFGAQAMSPEGGDRVSLDTAHRTNLLVLKRSSGALYYNFITLYRLLMDKKILIASLVVVATLAAGYAFHTMGDQDGDLDMTCGFTADFAAFLKKS
jgi:hypothetical protein